MRYLGQMKTYHSHEIPADCSVGIGFECILRASFGISIAPTFGASFMATGVIRHAMTKVIQSISIYFIFIYYPPLTTRLLPQTFRRSFRS